MWTYLKCYENHVAVKFRQKKHSDRVWSIAMADYQCQQTSTTSENWIICARKSIIGSLKPRWFYWNIILLSSNRCLGCFVSWSLGCYEIGVLVIHNSFATNSNHIILQPLHSLTFSVLFDKEFFMVIKLHQNNSAYLKKSHRHK